MPSGTTPEPGRYVKKPGGALSRDERSHQRIHAGHNRWVIPEEERFVTGDFIGSTCLVGTAKDRVESLLAFEAAGLDPVMILPAFEPRDDVLRRVAKEVLPHLDQSA